MGNIQSLSKILNIKDLEKLSLQKEYKQIVERFEDVGTKLYHVLKKKEEAEKTVEVGLKNKMEAHSLFSYYQYIDKLAHEESDLQNELQNIRMEMDLKQQKLTDAHVEVKKFETLIDRQKQYIKKEENRMEALFMDELSMLQFVAKRN
ncbi:flagellar export protein FliJ [Bacillaceae bacterium S4-13-56]